MAHPELLDVIEIGTVLGEGIQWNAEDECVWWTDIQASRLHRWSSAAGSVHTYAMPERVGSFAFTDRPGELLVAFETGIAFYQLETGALRWAGRPESPFRGRRFNDGRADRQGRFWAGTMVESHDAQPGSASLFCVDRAGTMFRQVDGLGIANGLCFSPDSRFCYLADSARNQIYQYVFDADSGALADRSLFAESLTGGSPDGAAVDVDGCIWSAQWGAGEVIRYTPGGEVDFRLRIPARQPSCVAFGGRDLDLLFVTSARDGLTAQELAQDRAAGHVFIFRTGHTGLLESRYRPTHGA